jgi:hypothetical protein
MATAGSPIPKIVSRTYLPLNNVEHAKSKVRRPQTNGISERFNKAILREFYLSCVQALGI